MIVVARDGEWVRPGVVAMNAPEVPEQRRPVTLPHEPLQHGGTRAAAWPAPDGEMPDAVWMTVDGYAAADVERVQVSTALDRHEATVRPDGSFLTLLRATPREKPRLRMRLTTGEHLDVSLQPRRPRATHEGCRRCVNYRVSNRCADRRWPQQLRLPC